MSRNIYSSAPIDAAADKGPHPLCPGCGYDLFGSLRSRRRICPECGRKFARHELLPGAWTHRRGLWSATWVLGLRSLAALPVCFLLTYVMAPGMAAPPYGGILLQLAAAGLGLGAWLGRDLVDVAGHKSLSLTVLATAFAWATVVAGVVPAVLLKPVDGWAEFFALHTTAIFATFWVLRATALSD
jgi:hypothetical protein